MLVVIGMITIVTAVALPSLRGLFEDFRINQTVQEADTLISSYRSYYLIMNEFPADTNADSLRNFKADWCLPRNFYTVSPHKFSVKPYKGDCFDFEQWTDNIPAMTRCSTIFINMRGISDSSVIEKYKAKFSNLYPKIPLTMDGTKNLGVVLPELVKEYCESEAFVHRNRYH